ncbi:MAG: GNAT family N-acetyltransferase [Candidatus Hermodarchaeota archaeon]
MELFSSASPEVVTDLTKLWFLQAKRKSSLHFLYHLIPNSLALIHLFMQKLQQDDNYIVIMFKNESSSMIGYAELFVSAYSPTSAIDQVAHIWSYYFPNSSIQDQALRFIIQYLQPRVKFIFYRADLSQQDILSIFQTKGFVSVQERWVAETDVSAVLTPTVPLSITIRKANEQDFPQVALLWLKQNQFHRQFHEMHIIKEGATQIWCTKAQEKQKTSEYKCFVAVAKNQNNKIIAYVESEIRTYPPWYCIEKYGLIQTLYVLPSYRRQGIAQCLVKTIIKEFLSSLSSPNPIMIDVDKRNHLAQKFWTKLGFRPRQVLLAKKC